MFGKPEKFTFDAKKLKKSQPSRDKLAESIEPGLGEKAESVKAKPPMPLAKEPPQNRSKKDKQSRRRMPWYRNKKIVGVLLIVLSLVITLGANPTLGYLSQQKNVTAVVVNMEIAVGQQITAEMISEVSEPASAILPIQQLTSSMVVGQYAASQMVTGEIVSKPKLSAEMPFDNAYLYTLPTNKKAVSVSVAALSSSLSGKLMAGDIVSVYVPTFTEDKSIRSIAEQPPELTYVEVLSMTNLDGIDITKSPDVSELGNPLPATITLAADDAQAVILAGSEVRGGVHLALVARGNAEMAARLLDEQSSYNITIVEATEKGGANE